MCEGRFPLFSRGGKTDKLALRSLEVVSKGLHGSWGKLPACPGNLLLHSDGQAGSSPHGFETTSAGFGSLLTATTARCSEFHPRHQSDGRDRFNRDELKPRADREKSPLE
jgi:hypothetical protein